MSLQLQLTICTTHRADILGKVMARATVNITKARQSRYFVPHITLSKYNSTQERMYEYK
jgi:hypothetical protein